MAQPKGTPKDRALRLLGVRWRSREELRRRLRRAGFGAEEVEAALSDLEGAGLIQDERFAREVVRDQAGRRLVGDRGIRAALRERGVPPDVVETALDAAGDEGARAATLAGRKAARMAGLDPRIAHRRLYGLLLRRGYAAPVASRAAREALAATLPDDADADGGRGPGVLRAGRPGRTLRIRELEFGNAVSDDTTRETVSRGRDQNNATSGEGGSLT